MRERRRVERSERSSERLRARGGQSKARRRRPVRKSSSAMVPMLIGAGLCAAVLLGLVLAGNGDSTDTGTKAAKSDRRQDRRRKQKSQSPMRSRRSEPSSPIVRSKPATQRQRDMARNFARIFFKNASESDLDKKLEEFIPNAQAISTLVGLCERLGIEGSKGHMLTRKYALSMLPLRVPVSEAEWERRLRAFAQTEESVKGSWACEIMNEATVMALNLFDVRGPEVGNVGPNKVREVVMTMAEDFRLNAEVSLILKDVCRQRGYSTKTSDKFAAKIKLLVKPLDRKISRQEIRREMERLHKESLGQ